jgi:hypothetical protein
MDINRLRNLIINKKYLPYLSLVSGVVVFGGVAIKHLYLSNRYEETGKVSQQSNSSGSENLEKEGEVAGFQYDHEEDFESITPSISKTKYVSPTTKPEVKSNTDEKPNNQNGGSNKKTTIEERVVVEVTAAPNPTSIPTQIPSPSPTPTPDLRPFEASSSRDGNKAIVTANKIIAECSFTTSSPSGNLSINSNDKANGTNTCEVDLSNSGWSYSITVKSESGETKTFGGIV